MPRVASKVKSALWGNFHPCVNKNQLLGSNIRVNDRCVMDHSSTCLDQKVKQSILVQSRGQVFKWWVQNFDNGHGHDYSIYGIETWWLHVTSCYSSKKCVSIPQKVCMLGREPKWYRLERQYGSDVANCSRSSQWEPWNHSPTAECPTYFWVNHKQKLCRQSLLL